MEDRCGVGSEEWKLKNRLCMLVWFLVFRIYFFLFLPLLSSSLSFFLLLGLLLHVSSNQSLSEKRWKISRFGPAKKRNHADLQVTDDFLFLS
jgi:hypothetical protein